MNELIKHEPQQLALSKRATSITEIIVDVNMLQGFPVPFDELKVWSVDIDRLCPTVTREQLTWLFDQFKTGSVVWDRNKGIQNILENLKLIYEEEGQLKIRRQVW